VGYLCVSTTRQADNDIHPEGYSLPAQREACYRRAAELGADVVDEYLDRGEPAKTTDRPNFLGMVHRIQQTRDVDVVILDKITRFARNRRDDASVLFELRKAGCKLVSVKENIDETPAGSLMHGILATIAEYESRNNGAEALKGTARKAQVGGTPGRAPVGYCNVTRMVEGRPVKLVEIDLERALHVRWAFEEYGTGQSTLTTSTQALAERGLKALPHGRKPPGPLARSMVGSMLKNRYHIGIFSFDGAEYPGRHEPLIPEALFDQVQQQLETAATASEKRRIHHH
jgi:DNA invertase Pin-like site-specific DNA recombinase